MDKPMCSIEDCDRAVLSRTWCSMHYQRWRSHGDPLATLRPSPPEVCSVDGCDGKPNEPGSARGYCRKHYMRWQRHGDPEASASCAGCGSLIPISPNYAFCTRNPDCRRKAKALTRARNPETARRARARADKTKRRAAEKRYKNRPDRICVRRNCTEYAQVGVAYCQTHNIERNLRRYARIRLRIPLRLYEQQGGMCPGADYGGCDKPLGDPDGNHVDHIIPEVRNGPNEDWNLQLMHPDCNLSKSDRLVPAALILAKEYGITLRRPDGGRPRQAA